MQSDDRVLVAYVKDSADFDRIQRENWYRIPVRHAPKGIYAEYIAFYFGKAFGDDKYAIHYVARNRGHELTMRQLLFPDEPDHPRANELYYKIQLADLRRLDRPIVSLRWRRVLFIHTTGDRFLQATEVNDLLMRGDNLTDRSATVLGESAETPYIVSQQSAA